MESKKLQKIVMSAPGKVILHGDHSVVYGKRGIAVSLDLRTTLTLTRNNDTVTLDLPDVKIRECWSLAAVQRLYNLLGITNKRSVQSNFTVKNLQPQESKIIKDFLCINSDSQTQRTKALLSFFHFYTSLLPCVEGFTIYVSSQIPTGAGLGSSAAYAVCLAGALLVLSGTLSPSSLCASAEQKIRKNAMELSSKWTYTSEAIMHGTPSGIDNTTCSFGGVISFKDGNINTEGSCGLQIMLVNTKVPRSTEALVTSVRHKHDKYPHIINPILNAMDALAEHALTILKELSKFDTKSQSSEILQTTIKNTLEGGVNASTISSLYEELGELIDMNHKLLGTLGVSHPTLEKVVELSSEHGLHAKLTGAGGGGFALILVPLRRKVDTFKQCMDALQSLGCQVWMVDLGVPGLCLHSTS